MKLFVVAAVLGVCSAARLDNAYLPPRGNSGSGSNAGLSSPGFGGFNTQHSGNAYNAPAQTYNAGGFNGGFNANAGASAGANAYSGAQNYNSRPQDANAQILRQNIDVKEDSFAYDFETSNGIRADASGVATNGVQSHGSFGYKGDDGQDYSITYTADENGYQPQGAHLPTPPPIPEEILKSLEQNARDEAAGIVDDGQYRGEGAGGHQGGYGGSQGGYSGNQGGFGGNQGGFSGNQGGFGGNQGGFQKSQGFGGAPSRQYLTPNSGSARSGNGNFNQKSGYHY